MLRGIAAALIFLSLPFGVHAATLLSGDSVVASTPFTGNLYATGGDVRLATEALGDVFLAGGTLTIASPVQEDALLFGGTVDVQQSISGDARILAGRIVIDKSVKGDLMMLAGSITALQSVPETYAVGSAIDLRGGAIGPVTLYGGTVTLAGDFEGDVNVTVSDKLVLAPGTTVHGSLNYNAPQEVVVPADAKILGKVEYTGSSSFVPSPEEAKNFAVAGAGIFFLVKLLATLLVVGLVAGLFPEFASNIAGETLGSGPRRFTLLFLLGFAIAVAGPVLALLLALSFAGIGLAFLLMSAYVLLLLLAGVYAGILAGAALARTLWKRTTITWKDALIGTLLLTIISIIPFVGGFLAFVLAITALGALVRAFYVFAFTRKQNDLL